MIDNNNNSVSENEFWDTQYKINSTGWDMGIVSPPIKNYIDQLSNKNLKILIPGCGNSYEAEYLIQNGFTNVTVIDISPTLVNKLKEKFTANDSIKILLGDFFEHKGNYEIIFEQTFFCAINPSLREKYIEKMHELLLPGGKLIGVLFDREFDFKGPPYGGFMNQYIPLFEKHFKLKTFEKCYNSFYKRKDTEIFINCLRK